MLDSRLSFMSLYNGPPRPGARGGGDQFNWENVKNDKDREFYLGHSVKALAGRWQKGTLAAVVQRTFNSLRDARTTDCTHSA